jgi:hypothetical protein
VPDELTSRAEALREVVDLSRRHGLSAGEILAALGEPAPRSAAEAHRRAVLVRVFGYLGGTFVFAGIGVFIALQWDSLNSAARVVVTLGPGLTAMALALLSVADVRFAAATTPLLLVAAAVEPTGMAVAFREFGTGGDWRWASLIICATMVLQFGAMFVRLRQSTPLFVVMTFATMFWWTGLDLLDLQEKTTATIVGGWMTLAAVGIDRTEHGDITPVFYFFGSALFLYGLFDSIKRTAFEIFFLAVSAAFVYLAAVLRTRTLLIVSILAILTYTGYFTGEHFADSVGWPLALIAFGLFMIGLSALAFRIDRQYLRRAG